jgi:hypothetical protein
MLESLLTIEEARQYDGGLGSQAERVATDPLPTGEPDLGNSSVGTLFDDWHRTLASQAVSVLFCAPDSTSPLA